MARSVASVDTLGSVTATGRPPHLPEWKMRGSFPRRKVNDEEKRCRRDRHRRTAGPADPGFPVWYVVLAGVLVASFDISHEFPSDSPARRLVPLGILLLHLALWASVLRQRMRYTRAVLRSARTRLLA